MIDLYGTARYALEAGLTLFGEDEAGKLWRGPVLPTENEPLTLFEEAPSASTATGAATRFHVVPSCLPTASHASTWRSLGAPGDD
ncbi:MAG: hypothetical protein WKG00_05220 [Polyangiaceae bacterium]